MDPRGVPSTLWQQAYILSEAGKDNYGGFDIQKKRRVQHSLSPSEFSPGITAPDFGRAPRGDHFCGGSAARSHISMLCAH